MFKIFKATAIVSITTISAIFVGVIRAKYTAITLGPSGVGIFSQALNFLQFGIALASLSIGLGVTKYISKYNSEGKRDQVSKVIASSVWMQTGASLVLILAVAIFSKQVSSFLFSTNIYSLLIIVVSLGIPFSVLAGNSEAIFFGFENYKPFAIGRTISAALSLVPLFLLIAFMHLKGCFFYLAINSIIAFSVFFYLSVKNLPKGMVFESFERSNVKGLIDKDISKGLLSYAGASFAATALNLFTILVLRSLTIKYFGTEGNGYYQVVFAVSGYYLPFFTNGLWTYFYPRMSALKEDSREYSIEMNKTVRFIVMGMTPAIIGLFLMRDILIRVIFSGDFLQANTLFSTQLFGDLFFLAFYILGTSLLASTRLKAYIISGLGYSISYIGIFLLLYKVAGLRTITISYMATNIIWVALLIAYHALRMKLVLYRRNIILIAASIALISLCLFIGGNSFLNFVIKTALVLVWAMYALTEVEKRKALAFIRDRFKKRL